MHVNAATAWLYGCDALNGTVFGFGERTGNPPLESAIFEYIALKGDLCGIDTTAITELADYMRSIGLPIPDNYPFVGKHFNTTRATGDERISKIKVHRLFRWVTDQYEREGRLTAISDEELEARTKELLPDHWAKYKGGDDE